MSEKKLTKKGFDTSRQKAVSGRGAERRLGTAERSEEDLAKGRGE